MYESFYGLKEKPFSIQPDPDFLFMSQRHTLAYSMLEYGLMSRAGFTVICGDIGCGKTTLIRRLLNTLGEDVRVGLVTNTHQDMGNLLEWIMLSYDLPFEGKSQVSQYDAFQKFLIAEYGKGHRVVLIVDEAQNLSVSALEYLRMLSNINADKDQLLQVVLVGQPQLRTLLKRPELQQFAQRVAADFYISPLNSVEVGDYIDHVDFLDRVDTLMALGRPEARLPSLLVIPGKDDMPGKSGGDCAKACHAVNDRRSKGTGKNPGPHC